MKEIPPVIVAAFGELKRGSPARLVLKLINEKYYVYKEHGVWLKDQKRNKTISEYIGRITTDGSFIKKQVSYKNDLQKAEALIAEHGGQIVWNKQREEELMAPEAELTSDEIDKKLLTILSMNSRASFAFMSKRVGLTVPATYSRVKRLEQKYGIKYILEIDREKLGYTRFLGFIKFHDKKPSTKELLAAMADQPKINFAAITNGEYDIIFYLTEKTSDEAIDVVWKMESEGILRDYDSEWVVTPISNNYGYMPIGDKFFDGAIKEKVWHRTKDQLRPDKEQLLGREFAVLRELNKDAGVDFKSIDVRYGFPKGATNYTYGKLEGRGIIRRVTISTDKLPVKYMAVLLLKYVNGKEYSFTRKDLLTEVINYNNITNKYALVGDIGSPHSIALFYPVLTDDELDKTVENIKSRIKGITVSTLIISTTLVGSICYRMFDNNHSRQYEILASMKAVKAQNRFNHSKHNKNETIFE